MRHPGDPACYPFPFRFTVAYRLAGNTLTQEYTVENTGEETMWFGLGAHPGFRVPLEEGLDFTDYCLEFVPDVSPVRVGFTPQCFLSGEDTPYPLEHGRLPLRHDLFDQDAIVLRDCGSQVTLRSAKGKRAVKAEFAGIPFLGIWHQPKMAAPYVCIEPWCSCPPARTWWRTWRPSPPCCPSPPGSGMWQASALPSSKPTKKTLPFLGGPFSVCVYSSSRAPVYSW